MNIGFMEIGVIFVLALLVFGPRKLPEIAKMVGKAMRMFREASDEVRRTLEEDIRVEEHKKLFKDVGQEVSTELKKIADEADSELDSVLDSEPEPEMKKEEPVPAEVPTTDFEELEEEEFAEDEFDQQ